MTSTPAVPSEYSTSRFQPLDGWRVVARLYEAGKVTETWTVPVLGMVTVVTTGPEVVKCGNGHEVVSYETDVQPLICDPDTADPPVTLKEYRDDHPGVLLGLEAW